MAQKERSQLESDAIKRVRKMAKVWGISEKEAEERAKQYIPHNSVDALRAFIQKPVQNITLNSLNPAHEASDRILEQIEREVSQTYNRASKEMQEKVQKYLEKFDKRDQQMQDAVNAGKMTAQEYQQWRQGQFFTGERWKHMRDELAEDASNSNEIAKSVAYGHMPDVYAENFNYGTYEVEHGAKINTSFTLYDRQTVERMMRENPKLLPDPAAGSATARAIAKNKDLHWNRQHIQGELLQGILQGESIPDIAKRLRNVESMNKKASMRYARTMTTGAENGGRIDSYERAKKMGIDVGPAWMATLDNRTRDSHRALDGETRDEKTGKFSNGCRFPGDPEGRPEEVYNCRCTLVGQIKGFENDFSDLSWRKSDKLGEMDYDTWKKVKSDKIPDFASDVGKKLTASGIDYRKPKLLNKKMTDDENIAELSGGDQTQGSCSSLAFAWAGRQAGLDIHDFRDGASCDFFATNSNIVKIIEMAGGTVIKNEAGNDFTAAHKAMREMEEWKPHYLAVGRHAAVVRKATIGAKGGKPITEYSYLELQSRHNNGWHPLDDDALKNRFGCQKSHHWGDLKFSTEAEIIPIENLAGNDEFKNILGFIDTDIDKQHKGTAGHER